jgi:hypothetical protein
MLSKHTNAVKEAQMSSWNPPTGGGSGDPGQVPTGPQPPEPNYIPPPPPGQGYVPPGTPGQGYPPPQGQGYPPPGPPGTGLPAPQWYGQPGMGGYPPQAQRRRGILKRLGIGGAAFIAVIIAVSVLVYQHNNHPWKLTAPSTAAGMPRDTNPLDTAGLSGAVTGARSAITKVPGYGTLKSSVSAAYLKGTGPLVLFIGFNGTLNQQIVLKSYQGGRVVTVNPGPHGGAAECASTSSLTFCQWSTTSTVGDLIIRASDILGGPVSTATADSLMIKIRNSVEHSA